MTDNRWIPFLAKVLLLVGLLGCLVMLHARVTRLESAVTEMQNQIIRLQLGEPPR